MAETIKTIKPAGGGDYTSLLAWFGFAKNQSTADQWAECYGDGTSLGRLALFSFTGTPSASEYVRIYAAPGQEHNGKDDGAGAFISHDPTSNPTVHVQENFTRIEGIRIESIGGNTNEDILVQASNVTIDGNLIIRDSGATAGGICIRVKAVNGVTHAGVVVRNNTLQGSGVRATGLYALADGSTSSATLTWECYNNTIHDHASIGLALAEVDGKGNRDGTLNSTVINNVVTDSGLFDYLDTTTPNGTLTANNNLSSDATGDDFGATGSLINKNAADQYIAEATDWNLLSTADAFGAGATIGDFDHDALHVPDDDWRPQDAAWDMGAIERHVWGDRFMGVASANIAEVMGVPRLDIAEISGVA